MSQGRHDLNFYITDCLIDANRAEITLARLAEKRATDPEIKQFAEAAIQDHTAFLNKLQQGARQRLRPSVERPIVHRPESLG